jgi:bifunctional non-homologous end joining protein LigD
MTNKELSSGHNAPEESAHRFPESELPVFHNLDKIYWPEKEYTKGDLLLYYAEIAPILLPYLKDRPMNLHRFPDGINGESFWQKEIDQVSNWIKTVKIPKKSKDGVRDLIFCEDERTILYLANLGCIEMNPWNSRIGALENPDYLMLDLDPRGIDFTAAVTVAQTTKDLFDDLGINGFIKTSGGKGLHIVVPLGAEYPFETVRVFSEVLSRLIHQKLSDITSLERSPAKRQGKVYLDYLQNRFGQSTAAVYSVRPTEQATVSTPLRWDEVTTELSPDMFTIKTLQDRLGEVGDLWQEMFTTNNSIEEILPRLQSTDSASINNFK